jgi:ion channel-forming bestrophin family protein
MLLEKKIPFSYIAGKVTHEFFIVLIISLVVLLLTEKYQHFLPEMPLTVPAFIGTAISILLSFKLNQSYDRWWEARKVWGSIVNDSRSFVMQVQHLTTGDNESMIRKIAYRQIAWCYALGQSLRELNPTENLDKFVDEYELAAIGRHTNKPLALLQLHRKDLSELRNLDQLDVFSHIQLDSTLVRLCDAQGKAERIKSTVFPVTYRLFLHYIIYLFVVTLSIALEDVGGYFEIPLLIVLSMAFFLLERTANHMQNPFDNRPTDTAMTAIARTIEINIRQLLHETEVPQPHQPDGYYLT